MKHALLPNSVNKGLSNSGICSAGGMQKPFEVQGSWFWLKQNQFSFSESSLQLISSK